MSELSELTTFLAIALGILDGCVIVIAIEVSKIRKILEEQKNG